MGNHVKKMKKDEISKFYDIKGKLGTGSFAVVKKAVRKADNKEFAIKIISKNKLKKDELAVVHDEVEIMHKIDHPNCVKLYEIFETDQKLFMVVELLTGGELFDRIVAKGSYSEKEAADLIRSITKAIKYLHEIGVVHRDLKPENLLYASPADDADIKITDFGLAKYTNSPQDDMTTACGTPGYVAPEVLKGQPYGKEVDLWSLGVILYILLCGFPPFYNDDTRALYKQIKAGDYDFPNPYWENISDSAKELVTKLLTVDPAKRYTPSQVLEHAWIAGDNVSTKAFDSTHLDRLRALQARRRLKRGVQMVIAVNRLGSAVRKSSGAESKEDLDDQFKAMQLQESKASASTPSSSMPNTPLLEASASKQGEQPPKVELVEQPKDKLAKPLEISIKPSPSK